MVQCKYEFICTRNKKKCDLLNCDIVFIAVVWNQTRNILRYASMSTKVPLVKAMVFPVVIYECESWTIKKAEH